MCFEFEVQAAAAVMMVVTSRAANALVDHCSSTFHWHDDFQRIGNDGNVNYLLEGQGHRGSSQERWWNRRCEGRE